MIVVDTNVIGCLYLTSERSLQSEQVLVMDPVWAAPLLWRSEFCNVLALYIRRNLLSPEGAQQIMAEATTLMQDREYTVAPLQVLDLVVSSTCSAYDCEFVVLAQDLQVPLVTVDRQILDQFPEVAVSLEAYLGA